MSGADIAEWIGVWMGAFALGYCAAYILKTFTKVLRSSTSG